MIQPLGSDLYVPELGLLTNERELRATDDDDDDRRPLIVFDIQESRSGCRREREHPLK